MSTTGKVFVRPRHAAIARVLQGLDASLLTQWDLVRKTVPQAAWHKARKAYGTSIDRALLQGLTRLHNAPWLTRCCESMAIDTAHQAALYKEATAWLKALPTP